ncbi:MAG: DUF6499 domain-containing protein [Methylomonas sp.]|jgi:hypothetical protein|uniref:transcriptional regulator domain-containing protein n=1 Tax=Methylomonas sp. TaxID=418 RepID=UPI0025E1849C|nr:DUF6499 domain-containing protein [Methylomonas sp.]MCK9608934.1 DUF6499 domain-containing protein [Methylomonas sp.]
MNSDDSTHCKSLLNWKNNCEYNYLENAEKAQFAWEFLRRNKGYQSDYEKYKDFPGRKIPEDRKEEKGYFFKYYDAHPPTIESESYADYLERIEKEDHPILRHISNKYFSKRNEFTSFYDLRQHSKTSKYNYTNKVSPGFELSSKKYPVFIDFGRNIDRTIINYGTGNVYVKLSLLQNIEKQLAILHQEMENRHAKLISKIGVINEDARERETMINCLRVYDAQLNNAKWNEVICYVFAESFSSLGWAPNCPEDLLSTPKNIKRTQYDLISYKIDSLKTNIQKLKKFALAYIDGGYLSLLKENDSISLSQSGKRQILQSTQK